VGEWEKPRVGLFVTCLVDLFRPSVGLAAARLIEEAGCRVEVPMAQACCGQPAFASGEMTDARAAAEAAILAFEDFDHVVAPSGACAGMLRNHYPGLFRGDPAWETRARDFAAKVHELTSFLVDISGMSAVAATRETTATYHDACSGFGELGVKDQPRALLASVKGLKLIEMHDADACCGFGGAVCAKYPDLARAKADRKAGAIAASGADLLIAGDLGCLMKIAGKLRREGSAVEVRHVAEVLAGMNDDPPIGGRRVGSTPEAPTESAA
jgi:L-lactate dehydrogenase complex protein LldE